MAPVDMRDYVISGIYDSVLEPRRCAKHNVAAKTRRAPNAGPMLALHLQRLPSIKPALVQRLVFAGLRSVATGPVLASIHSALVSTSCWQCRHDAINQSWVNVGPSSVTLAHI